MTATFDASGCPSEFIAVARQLEADIEDKMNLIAKENQLIEDAKKQIAEKPSVSKQLECKNAELEANITHLNSLFENKVDDNMRIVESRELLKEQAKNMVDLYEITKEKNQLVKDNCEAKYNNYIREFQERMAYYDSLPFVPEYKEKMLQLVELRKVLEQKTAEEECLKQQRELLERKKESTKPKLSMTEWGIKLAKLYRETQKIDLESAVRNIQSHKQEIEKLIEKKRQVEELESLARAEEQKAGIFSQLQSESQTDIPSMEVVSPAQLAANSKVKQRKLTPYVVPDFRSFFKDRSAFTEHKRGASGSGIKRFGSGLPDKSSLFEKAKQRLDLPRSFVTGCSLEEWLNPSTAATKLPSSSQQTEENKTVKSLPAFSHARATELPLLRQVQEKMIQKKIETVEVGQNEQSNADEPSKPDEAESNDSDSNQKPNLLAVFDGPTTYEMPTLQEDAKRDLPKLTKNVNSPERFSWEKHQQMMAELQKSPDDYFRYQSHVMSMEGSEHTDLLSPDHIAILPSKVMTSPDAEAGDFKFAVPTDPPPTQSKRSGSSGDFSFTAGLQELSNKEESSGFERFSFEDCENTEKKSNATMLPFNLSKDRETSSGPPSFSFSFGSETATSPETETSVFSFGTANAQSPEKSETSFFSSKIVDEEESTSSFASLFGC